MELSTAQEISSILWNLGGGGALPHSQELLTCLYPKPEQSSPYHPYHHSKINLNIIHHLYILVFLVLMVSFLLAFPSITYIHSSSPHSCYMPRSSHPRLDHSNYTRQRVQVKKLLVMQFTPPPLLHPSSAKYSP
jgi:hypothetical protein